MSTLFLIFVGGMVTSTGSGLAVPDWPLSYGSLFPPMVGGVFYEHGHRMVATLVGFFTLMMTIGLTVAEKRRWMRRLGWVALAAVILQGLLGGLTVRLFLPASVSIAHGMLAQTFFLLTIMLAYGLSMERSRRDAHDEISCHRNSLCLGILVMTTVYIQLFLGALMRHTKSWLAIPDFPTMGGMWIPLFNQTMLDRINVKRFELNLDFVTMNQVFVHFLHRLWAVAVLAVIGVFVAEVLRHYKSHKHILTSALMLSVLVCVQMLLGILTILSGRAPLTTTFHVALGALTLGWTMFLILRIAPLRWDQFVKVLSAHA